MLNDSLMKEVVSDYFSGYKRDYFTFNVCLTSEIAVGLLKNFTCRKDTELGLSTMKDGDLYSLYLFYLHTLDNPFGYIDGVGYVLQSREDMESYNTDDIIRYVDSIVSDSDVRKEFLDDYRWIPSCLNEIMYVYEQYESIAKRIYLLVENSRDFSFELSLLRMLLSRVHDLGESLKTCPLKYGVGRGTLLDDFYRRYGKMDEIYNSARRIKAQAVLYNVQSVKIVQ